MYIKRKCAGDTIANDVYWNKLLLTIPIYTHTHTYVYMGGLDLKALDKGITECRKFEFDKCSVGYFISCLLFHQSSWHNCVSCYAGFDGWWYTFEFEVWIVGVYDPVSFGNSATCMFL